MVRVARTAQMAVTAIMVAVCGAGCGSGAPNETAPQAPPLFPATVASCDDQLTVHNAPQRAVVVGQNLVELMFALGLQDRMVGYAGVGPSSLRPPEHLAAYESVPSLTDGTPTLQQIVDVDADIVLAEWLTGFNLQRGPTPELLAEVGVDSYALSESCRRVADNLGPATVEQWFGDVRAIGAIFGVPDRAEQLVEQWQATLAEVASCVPATRDRSVFVFAGGDTVAHTAPGLTIATDVAERAGGRNTLADVPRLWGSVPWRDVAAANPDLVVVVDNGTGPTPQQLIDTLKANSEVKGLPAVAEDKFLVLPQTAVHPGPRTAAGVAQLAAALHPDSCPA